MDTYKLLLNLKSEQGDYIVQLLDNNGFVDNSMEVKPDDLPIVMREMVDLCGEDTDKLLDTLRVAYSTLNLKNIIIKTKD